MGIKRAGTPSVQISPQHQIAHKEPSGKKNGFLQRLGFSRAKVVKNPEMHNQPGMQKGKPAKPLTQFKLQVIEPHKSSLRTPEAEKKTETHVELKTLQKHSVEGRQHKMHPDYFSGLQQVLKEGKNDFQDFIDNFAGIKDIVKTQGYLKSTGQLSTARKQILEHEFCKKLATQAGQRICFTMADSSSSASALEQKLNSLLGQPGKLLEKLDQIPLAAPYDQVSNQTQFIEIVKREIKESMEEVDIIFDARAKRTPGRKMKNRHIIQRSNRKDES